MNVLVKCFIPEYYEAADSAVIEVTENLILMLDKRLAQAKAMNDSDFYGTKWWDYTPYFIPTSGPDSVGLDDMDEGDFDRDLESNGYIRLPDDFKEEDSDAARMDYCTLTVSAVGFGWAAMDKYVSCLVETYEQGASVVDEWAELIGCTEMLAKVRACRGEVLEETP